MSLSCLGNVIHALTSGSDHIPYRDSKLTRILQESLGGNYKTSLITTASPHSSSLEEAHGTMKFATRAKTIKTKFKMNVMTSPEALQKMLGDVKRELNSSKNELTKYKLVVTKIKEEFANNPELENIPELKALTDTLKIIEESDMNLKDANLKNIINSIAENVMGEDKDEDEDERPKGFGGFGGFGGYSQPGTGH